MGWENPKTGCEKNANVMCGDGIYHMDGGKGQVRM